MQPFIGRQPSNGQKGSGMVIVGSDGNVIDGMGIGGIDSDGRLGSPGRAGIVIEIVGSVGSVIDGIGIGGIDSDGSDGSPGSAGMVIEIVGSDGSVIDGMGIGGIENDGKLHPLMRDDPSDLATHDTTPAPVTGPPPAGAMSVPGATTALPITCEAICVPMASQAARLTVAPSAL